MILLLFLLLPLIHCVPVSQMIIVWGEPEQSTPSKVVDSWEECNIQCLSDPSCVLTSKNDDGSCRLFYLDDIKTVRKLSSDSGKIVGFKRTLESNQCTVAEDPPLFGLAEVTEATNYTISRTTLSDGSVIWMFNMKCEESSWKSIRGQNAVCLEIRLFPDPYCGTFNDAVSLCSDAMGMSGPYNAAEEQKMRSTGVALYEAVKISKATFANNGLLVDGVWKEDPRVYTITDNTLNGTMGYQWNADYKSSEACAFITCPDSNKIRTTECGLVNYRPYYNNSCHRGAVCRTIPYS